MNTIEIFHKPYTYEQYKTMNPSLKVGDLSRDPLLLFFAAKTDLVFQSFDF